MFEHRHLIYLEEYFGFVVGERMSMSSGAPTGDHWGNMGSADLSCIVVNGLAQLLSVLKELDTIIPYDGIRLARMHQSSAPKGALLLHRARNLSITAAVPRIPQAMLVWMIALALGLSTSMMMTGGTGRKELGD